jgi:hypothetical protein
MGCFCYVSPKHTTGLINRKSMTTLLIVIREVCSINSFSKVFGVQKYLVRCNIDLAADRITSDVCNRSMGYPQNVCFYKINPPRNLQLKQKPAQKVQNSKDDLKKKNRIQPSPERLPTNSTKKKTAIFSSLKYEFMQKQPWYKNN